MSNRVCDADLFWDQLSRAACLPFFICARPTFCLCAKPTAPCYVLEVSSSSKRESEFKTFAMSNNQT